MSGAAQHWDEALVAGRLLLQRPVGGGAAVFPPRECAPGNGAALEWFEASGRGTVYSVTWVQRRPPEEPYNVVLVDLAEGARLMGRVEGVTETSLQIGMAVRARIAEGPVIVFDPAGEGTV
ncbi:Zn-ribbon domain-containing OB-fold protein [Novosphingobium piscinae]|uniref:OB-fold domain-containing protein n=1 Tax=Novosphingobium piscinae TaxID=1507448 RepID=A0A7X1FZD1_9SPHN|nr:OB-fold domain-containing protein [Novosphingobium piscinae]MBC2669799.1 OB-fold domain-containing protein [Novosphingobium piscinae]